VRFSKRRNQHLKPKNTKNASQNKSDSSFIDKIPGKKADCKMLFTHGLKSYFVRDAFLDENPTKK
jgi:hypothetical protein